MIVPAEPSMGSHSLISGGAVTTLLIIEVLASVILSSEGRGGDPTGWARKRNAALVRVSALSCPGPMGSFHAALFFYRTGGGYVDIIQTRN